LAQTFVERANGLHNVGRAHTGNPIIGIAACARAASAPLRRRGGDELALAVGLPHRRWQNHALGRPRWRFTAAKTRQSLVTSAEATTRASGWSKSSRNSRAIGAPGMNHVVRVYAGRERPHHRMLEEQKAVASSTTPCRIVSTHVKCWQNTGSGHN
jgi:hypothetical protein